MENYLLAAAATPIPIDLDKIQQGAFPSAMPLSSNSVGHILSTIVPYIFGAAGIALLIYLIIGGFQFMLSRGDPKAMQSAQAKITNALIGFVIVVFAFTIVQLFGQIFGIKDTLFGQIFKGRSSFGSLTPPKIPN